MPSVVEKLLSVILSLLFTLRFSKVRYHKDQISLLPSSRGGKGLLRFDSIFYSSFAEHRVFTTWDPGSPHTLEDAFSRLAGACR
jgi:hypothetical protein